MIQATGLVSCSMCGNVDEVNIPITENVVINYEILRHRVSQELNGWEYVPSTDEFICGECESKPVLFKLTQEMISEHREYFKKVIKKKTWNWDKLVKYEIARQVGIDSDALTASQVEVKAYMNPHNMDTEFYIKPVGMKWSDIKKRHSVKEPEPECLGGG